MCVETKSVNICFLESPIFLQVKQSKLLWMAKFSGRNVISHIFLTVTQVQDYSGT